jgi:beta-glucosidase
VAEPVKELKGVRRVTLQPGEARTIVFKLGPEAMSLYDRQMRRVVEPGTFVVFAGTNSSDVIATPFEVTGDAFVLAPPTPRFR